MASYHDQAVTYTSLAQAEKEIARPDMRHYLPGMGAAHVMGGCTMADTPGKGVNGPQDMHWQVRNLSIHDGSVFPTSNDANPQLSIYGMAHRLTQQVLTKLAS